MKWIALVLLLYFYLRWLENTRPARHARVESWIRENLR